MNPPTRIGVWEIGSAETLRLGRRPVSSVKELGACNRWTSRDPGGQHVDTEHRQKHGTSRGSPRRRSLSIRCTAKTSRISRDAAKSRCACEWGGWGRLSEDGPGHYNPVWSEDPWGRAVEPLKRRWPSVLGASAQYEECARQAMGTKDGCKPDDAKTSLSHGKAPSDSPALKP